MGNSISDVLIQKTLAELANNSTPKQDSRVWKSSNGYVYLIPWSNASLLRIFIRRFTESLPPREFRLKSQMDDAGRSTVSTIEEGFARPTTREYLDFLGFSQASLIEIKGDTQRSRQDGLLRSLPGSAIASLGIDLEVWHEKLKATVVSKPTEFRGNYRKKEDIKFLYSTLKSSKSDLLVSFKFEYPPVDDLKEADLTYEIFTELINKTEWHLKRLVVSLEDKLAHEQKYYQVQQARMKEKFKRL